MRIKKLSKRGIEPVIATILLVVIAIALFGVIFMWVKNMQKESILKFGSAIELSCPNVNFNIIKSSSNSVQVQNRGSVAIYGAKLIVGGNSLPDIQGPISPGSASQVQGISCTSGQQIKVIPILLGTSQKTNAEKPYICKDQAKTITC
jgi:hypothetical protein